MGTLSLSLNEKYHKCLTHQRDMFQFISFTYLPKVKNQFVDSLATLASNVENP